jgi:hypothetical protein
MVGLLDEWMGELNGDRWMNGERDMRYEAESGGSQEAPMSVIYRTTIQQSIPPIIHSPTPSIHSPLHPSIPHSIHPFPHPIIHSPIHSSNSVESPFYDLS